MQNAKRSVRRDSARLPSHRHSQGDMLPSKPAWWKVEGISLPLSRSSMTCRRS
jgi:hypothetical protein